MIGSFLTRALILALGYAYPAYNCYKAVELNRPDIEKLRFWSKYWILVAVLTVVERFSDYFISWLPMYGEAKLALIVYLWYPKTMGSPYVYDTFLRPFVAKHEKEIDRNLIELRTRATDIAADYCSKALGSSQILIFEAIRYISTLPLASKTSPGKDNTPTQTEERKSVPSSDRSELNASSNDKSKPTEAELPEAMVKRETAQESVMEDAIRLTRAKLKRRVGSIGNCTESDPNTPK